MAPGQDGVPVEDPEAAEPTVVVGRGPAADPGAVERTVVVERDAALDRTVVVERGPGVDGTVAVTRERPAPGSPSVDPDIDPALGLRAVPRGRRRRGMSMPPVAPGYGRGAVDAPGAGAVLPHTRRDAPLPAPPPAADETGTNPATRGSAPSMPSVARLTRRTARVAIGSTAIAVSVSVVGLVVLGVALLRG